MPADAKRDGDSISGRVDLTGEAESEAVGPNSRPADLDLALVVAAWPTLPADVKTWIVATAAASSSE